MLGFSSERLRKMLFVDIGFVHVWPAVLCFDYIMSLFLCGHCCHDSVHLPLSSDAQDFSS